MPDNSFFKNFLLLTKERKLFEGEINYLQLLALTECMGIQIVTQNSIEEQRMRYTIFASNPALYQEIFNEKEESDEVAWITPNSAEELEDVIKLLEDI